MQELLLLICASLVAFTNSYADGNILYNYTLNNEKALSLTQSNFREAASPSSAKPKGVFAHFIVSEA
jgi:hypothetical protein